MPERDRVILAAIEAFFAEHGRGPSWDDIAAIAKVRSRDTLSDSMRRLRAGGYIATGPVPVRAIAQLARTRA